MKRKKLFMSNDFEGLAGITNWLEVKPTIHTKELATEQVNAFLKGIYFSHPDAEVLICDAHNTGDNLIYENLIGNTSIIKGYPRKFYMMQGLDSSFDGYVLFGYHSPIGHYGNMDHTYSASSIYNIYINDKRVDEATINMIYASYFQIPLLGIFADSASCTWLKENVSDTIFTIESKQPISRFAAKLEPFHTVLERLYQAGKNIFHQTGYLYPISDSYQLDIDFVDTAIAYSVQIIPGVESSSPRSIRIITKDQMELYQYLMTIIMIASSVKNLYKE